VFLSQAIVAHNGIVLKTVGDGCHAVFQRATDAGFTKNADGLWQQNGQTVNAMINGFEG
jgi:hypothetical protein